MLTKQIENYKKIYTHALSIIKEPEQFCRTLREYDKESRIGATRRYALPFIVLITITVFITYFFYSKHPQLEFAILKTLFSFLSIASGYLLAVFVCKKSTQKLFLYDISQKEAETVIAYSSTVIFGIQVIMAIFPGFFFIKFLGLYTLYILWYMSSDYIHIEERFRTYFMLLNSVSIVLLPIITRMLFQLLIPNVTI